MGRKTKGKRTWGRKRKREKNKVMNDRKERMKEREERTQESQTVRKKNESSDIGKFYIRRRIKKE